jgi:transcriptional regulator with XRE-family HTH domain
MKKQEKNPLVELIVKQMEIKDLNQYALAKLSNVAQPVISRLLNGSANIGTVNIYQILNVLNLFNIDNKIEHCEIKCDEKIKGLCLKVKKVVNSDSHWGKSLEANIHSFAAGLEQDESIKELKKSIADLSSQELRSRITKKTVT